MLPDIEKKSTSEIATFQEQKLSELLHYLNENSPYYKNKFINEAIDIHSVKSLLTFS